MTTTKQRIAALVLAAMLAAAGAVTALATVADEAQAFGGANQKQYASNY